MQVVDKKAITKQRERWRRAAVTVIAASRRDADLTQAELAARCGWQRDTVAKIEAGRRKIEFEDVLLLAQALKVDPEVLIRRIVRW